MQPFTSTNEDLLSAYPQVPVEIARQMVLEDFSVDWGTEKMEKRLEKAKDKGKETDTPVGMTLLRVAVAPLADAINAWRDDALSGGRGRKPRAAVLLRDLNAHTLAYLTSKVVLDTLTTELTLQTVSLRVAAMVHDDIRWASFQSQAPGLWYVATEKLKKQTGNYRHSRASLSGTARHVGLELPSRWSSEDCLIVGQKLIELMIESTGLIEVGWKANRKSSGRNPASRSKVLRPTPKVLDRVNEKNDLCLGMYPVFLPMVVEPNDWTNPFDGGYLGRLAGRHQLVRGASAAYLEDLESVEMPAVYDSINTLQRTGWRVNNAVHDVIREADALGLDVAGLPKGEIREVTPRPALLDNAEAIALKTPEYLAVLREWKHSVTEVHDHNKRMASHAMNLKAILDTAHLFREQETFYFPYNMDFRGRVYPVCGSTGMHPQGNDSAKGILQFSEGVVLGETGAYWLAVHLANSFGYDKAALDDRVRWVQEHTDEIMQSAMNPLDFRWWAEGDAPWQTLAACFDWMGYQLEGDAHVSHLPIAFDGSCNGLQHYSAMLRDEIGGKAVNLTPNETAADIYSEVMRQVISRMEREAVGTETMQRRKRTTDEAGEEVMITEHLPVSGLAQEWLASGQLDRKMHKRPVMTTPYGSKQYGIADQIGQELKSRGHSFGDTQSIMCRYLASCIWGAIGEVVVAARSGMDWLQKAAGLAASEGLPITWTAPQGFPVMQDYRKASLKKVKTTFQGVVMYLRLAKDTPVTDSNRMKNSIAPNYVHSLDAAAMMLTVQAAADQGLHSFSMVHDSYATHAGHAEILFGTIRESFVAMYENHDVLTEFRDNIHRQLSPDNQEELQALPPKGTLDLTGILESDFFFA